MATATTTTTTTTKTGASRALHLLNGRPEGFEFSAIRPIVLNGGLGQKGATVYYQIKKRRAIISIVVGVICLLIGILAGLASIGIGSYYAICLGSEVDDPTTCFHMAIPIVLALVSVAFLLIGMIMLIVGIRWFFILRSNVAPLANATIVQPHVKVTETKTKVTTVQPTTTTYSSHTTESSSLVQYNSTPTTTVLNQV